MKYAGSFFIVLLIVSTSTYASRLDLSGSWLFALDPEDKGVSERWYNTSLPDTLELPGSLQEQGFGEVPTRHSNWTIGMHNSGFDDPRFEGFVDDEDFHCPFWLTPKRHYVGVAWYQRTVKIPPSWQGQRIVLHLERVHWESSLWVDSQKIGTLNSLCVPHIYDITEAVRPGENNTITLRIDNRYRIEVGRDAHSVSDQTQSNWNGVIGRLSLESRPLLQLANVQVYPQVEPRRIRVKGHLQSFDQTQGRAKLKARVGRTTKEIPVHWEKGQGDFDFSMALDETIALWDEYQPALHTLQLELNSRPAYEIQFGLRELGIRDKQFTINGRTLFLRGTLECAIFPKHGYPPIDVAAWTRIIRIAKAHGLNHFRFHSWCPPEAAFIAADREGFYYQVEGPCWATFGDGKSIDTWVYEELDRILDTYGNHPSFMLMAPSNEPHGANKEAFLEKLVRHLKTKDPRHFYIGGAGWPPLQENEYLVQQNTRLERWEPLQLNKPPQTWADYRSYVAEQTVPVVNHEIGQYCVYPDLSEDDQYTGLLQPKFYAIHRDKLKKSGMEDMARPFLQASGKFQTLLYKQEIEAALRTPGFAGFQLLDLHDFPGQGVAIVGVLNAFWQPKGYVSPAEYRRFCNDVVPLARVKKRVFTSDDTMHARIDVANYSHRDLRDVTVHWQLTEKGAGIVQRGRFDGVTIPAGGLTTAGDVRFALQTFDHAAALNLDVSMAGLPYGNDWDLWVYPTALPELKTANLLDTDDPQAALKALKVGQDVLLSPAKYTIKHKTFGSFKPVFWNRLMFTAQSVHTLGILCDPKHAALATFPTDSHCNWHWQDLLDRSQPIILNDLPSALKPIIQPIDDWNDGRKLGVLFEARVGPGKLLLCAMDISNDLDQRPVARQLRHSLREYMQSSRFEPQVTLSSQSLAGLFHTPTRLQAMDARITVSTHHTGYTPHLAMDNDPKTFWHTSWAPRAYYPHHLTIDLRSPQPVTGLRYLPRQDQVQGAIGQYEIVTSQDGATWTAPIASGTWAANNKRKTVHFDRPVATRYIKLIAKSAADGGDYAAAAEIDILFADKSTKTRRPNVLWLVGEDMGQDLSCYGAPVVQTPNLDRLAREGTLFTNAYGAAPVCSSSRSAFNTGMYATSIGAHDHRTPPDKKRPLPDGVQTVSQWFAEAGYYTCLMGNPKKDFNFLEKGITFQGKDWSQRAEGQPFFCLYNFVEPHRWGWGQWDKLPQHLDPNEVVLPPIYPDHPVMRQSFAKYLDFILELDCKVGRVLQRLEAEGELDNTLIFFFGDNGRTMYRGKQWLYDEGLRVPLLTRFPKHFMAGTTRHDLVSLIDLAPTALSLAGVPVPPTMQGQVIAGPQARSRYRIYASRDLCDNIQDPMRCVRTERYKYIRNYRPENGYRVADYTLKTHPEYTVARRLHAQGKLTPAQSLMFVPVKPKEELYDLQHDPWETRNLANEPGCKETLLQLRKDLDTWLQKTNDQGLKESKTSVASKLNIRLIYVDNPL